MIWPSEKKNEARINTAKFSERKDISAKTISHLFLKSSFQTLPHCPTSRRKFPEEADPKLISQPHYSFPSLIQRALHILPSCKAPPDPISPSEELPCVCPSMLSPSAVSGWIPDPAPVSRVAAHSVINQSAVSWAQKFKFPHDKQKKWPVGSGCGGYIYRADLHRRTAMLGTSFRRQD